MLLRRRQQVDDRLLEKVSRCRRRSQHEADRRAHDQPSRKLWRAVVIDAGIPERACGDAEQTLHPCTGAAGAHEHPGVVPGQTHGRQSGGRGLIADGVLDQPTASAHQCELVGVGGDGVASDRGQVLKRQRTANQQVVRSVGARGIRTKGSRHSSARDVERPRRPGAVPDERRIDRAEPFTVDAVAFGPKLGQKRDVRSGTQRRRRVEADQVQGAVVVVGVVEVPGVVAADRHRGVAAKREPPVERRHWLRCPVLRGRG